ncbi:MAG: dihydroorotate dehydrogenase-like protein [Geothrix sp.]|uniref:dihydroorotate dehydrogenase-like protein n=1 Tax=Geothrix sp. TaxID=1962974 RepID=UPI00179C159F|nr:dihydroorotate dehydrogenase-like protein [Geothrix sp.]NWJ40835.1 dihydroorotate dehydrogenase-like protein [Geothrix sp.]WIL21163.1 MAG: dihydroorotate dehydrogenase-like protein [Geothrix sp.]
MNLSTTYLGLKLAHPLMAGASPMVDDMGMVKRLEDAGASAIVMHSLFEEQITREEQGTIMDMQLSSSTSAEALSFFPQPDDFRLGPEKYLEQIRRIKDAVSVPVIASLNGTTPAGWLHYGKLMQDAGADALELNVYYIPTDAKESASEVEKRTLDIVRAVKAEVKIPVSVKLSPFFSALAHFAVELEGAGADGLVLFNRFFQPDINVEELVAEPSLQLSGPSDLLLRLRWLAVLHGHIKGSLAVTGGVHDGIGALKAVMAGADAVQMVSALLIHGPDRLAQSRATLAEWLEEHEYESLAQARGSMSLVKSPNPQAFTRANYMRILNGWKP